MMPLNLHNIAVFEAASSPEFGTLPVRVLQALNEKGVVLLRGFHPNLTQFEILTQTLCSKFHSAGSRYKTRQLGGDSFSTGSMRTNYTLLAHSEGVYNPQEGGRPDIAFFMCDTPPVEPGGETLVVDGAAFYDEMPAEWRARFETGLIYEMRWEKERWQPEFHVDNIADLETHLARFPNVKYTLHGELLHLLHTTQGITKSRSGHKVFAPGMLTHLPTLTHPFYQDKKVHTKLSNGMYFGDGEAVNEIIINGLIDIHDGLAYYHVWQKGDILMLDNTRYLHGRTMTRNDCERVIITRFGWLK